MSVLKLIDNAGEETSPLSLARDPIESSPVCHWDFGNSFVIKSFGFCHFPPIFQPSNRLKKPLQNHCKNTEID
jgi:hypothetical protein